jgi:hypothetical protein
MMHALTGLPTYIGEQLTRAVTTPLRAMRLRYLPLLMVYFAYGALGITAVADAFWVRKELTLSASDLAGLGVWLSLPWTIKMVFGELVDTVPFLGSQRRSYVFLGAGLIAAGLLLLAGAAGGWLTFARPDQIYIAASLVVVLGVVLQDVVADAMSTEVVPRTTVDGSPRAEEDVRHELAMVQLLGRLALSLGAFAVAYLAGWLARHLAYSTVFLIGLVVPAISLAGALLVRLETSERRATDWTVLGGGLAFGASVALLGLSGFAYAQEFIFVISMTVIIVMLRRVTADLSPETRRMIALAAIVIFAFRATPGIGPGYGWFSMDELKFDEEFFGVLGQIGTAIGLVSLWLLSDVITRQPVVRILLVLTVLGTVLALPNLALVHRFDLWTEAVLGFGARTIAIIDTAASSPLAQVSMVPLLTLVAVYAPPGHRATWFALMASFMNMALVAGQLGTKYLNMLMPITRGGYAMLPALTWTSVLLGLVVPLAAILLVGRRVR